MLYLAYQAQSDLLAPLRAFAHAASHVLNDPANHFSSNLLVRHVSAACEMIARAGLTHARPGYDIGHVVISGEEVPVVEEAAHVTPFATLLHFRKEVAGEQPRVLVVAPLSGHFATLLRDTVRTLLPEHDVYITDWRNARDVPLADGRFGIDEYVDHVIRFLEILGPGAHLVGVCQPCVAVVAAAAVMAQSGNAAQPASMTLMAGPIDTRVNPTRVNELAASKPIEWFERNLISTVPGQHAGAGRRVYAGFIQLSAFMAMNMERHVRAHTDLYHHLVRGEPDLAEATKSFYDEYFAVLDLPAEFYLETVRTIFQEHALPLGELTWHGERIEPRAIRRTALLTVEGEKDDICGLGQTLAAQEVCSGLRPYRKRHHLQAGVGHYGVFSGKRWKNQIYPIVRNTILASN